MVKNNNKKQVNLKKTTHIDQSNNSKVRKKSKTLKRKSKEQPDVIIHKKKIRKQSSDSNNISDNDELREPTAEELRESEKKENIYSIKSGRTKQKEKHQRLTEEKKNSSKLKDVSKVEEYLKKWKNDRTAWKFEKLKQIFIMSSVFDVNLITEDLWPIALEYLTGSVGKAKEKVIELAEAEINKLDVEVEKGNRNLVKSIEYRRARELLQALN